LARRLSIFGSGFFIDIFSFGVACIVLASHLSAWTPE
jgi:hypothetical protein